MNIQDHIFVISYTKQWPASIEMVTKNDLLTEFLFSSVSNQGSGESWLESIDGALTQNKSSENYYGEGQEVIIDTQYTVIIDQIGRTQSKRIEVKTTELKELIKSLLELRREFMACRKNSEAWHGIPTSVSENESYEPMYYNPQTGTTGPWKDIEKDWS